MIKSNDDSVNSYYKLIDLGIKEVTNNNIEGASIHLKNAININSKKYEAFLSLSNIYILENNIKKAIELLKDYLVENKYEINTINHLGKIYLIYDYDNDLLNLFNYLDTDLTNNKNYYFLYYLQGAFYEKKKRVNYSINSYKKSIELNKNYLDVYVNLLGLLERTNNLSEFKLYLDSANIYFSDDYKIKYAEAFYYNRTNKFELSLKIFNKYNLINCLKTDTVFYPKILDLLSKNHKKLGNYDCSFNTIKERNNFLLELDQTKKFNKTIILDAIQTYKEFFVKEIFTKNIKLPNYNLIFLVGFPRSGTTLLDTILRTHSKTVVLEEKNYLRNIKYAYLEKYNNNINVLKSISSEEIIQLQQYYFKQINLDDNDKEKIIIDKLPLNIIDLGFIKLIFPEAKIILAIRHPCDIIISCYFNYFKLNDAMIHFLDLNDAVYFYNSVFNLFEHFEKELDLNYHTIKYEDLIENFKGTLEGLLKYINLDYEDKLEEFYITAKKREIINTPSYTQVIQPIYNTSINNYLNFKDAIFIKPLLEKWIDRFGYS